MSDTKTFRARDLVHVSWTTESANCTSLRTDVREITGVRDDGRVRIAGFESLGWVWPGADGLTIRAMTEQDMREYLAAHGYDADDLAATGKALAWRLYQEA